MSEPAVIQLRPRRGAVQQPVLLRPAEAAKRVSVSERTMYRWLERGIVPHVRLEGIPRIPVDALDAWWRERMVTA